MIVKMQKVTIIGMQKDRRAVLRYMQNLGILEIARMNISDGDMKKLQNANWVDPAERVNKAEAEISKVKEAIDNLLNFGVRVNSDITVDVKDFLDDKSYAQIRTVVSNINSLAKDIDDIKIEINSLMQKKQVLMPWLCLDVPVDINGTGQTTIIHGTIPQIVDVGDLFDIEVVDSDSRQHYISVIAHNKIKDRIMQQLPGFSPVEFEGLTGTIEENIKSIELAIEEKKERLENKVDELKLYLGDISELQVFYDFLINLRARREVQREILATDTTFIVGGWLPDGEYEGVKSQLEQKFGVIVEKTEPLEDEKQPTLLYNKRVVRPFEIITEMYSLPNSKEIDPNGWLSIFYFIFFGIMLGDAGYGLILTIGALIVIKKIELKGVMENLTKLLFYCGISTTIWGALFGSWFGNFSYAVFGHAIAPILFDPMSDPMRFLIMSFIFGAVHLMVGMGISGYMMIKSGDWKSAVFDVLTWYLVLIGAGMLFAGGALFNIGKYMIITGAVGLVLTQGRHQKNIFKKIGSGLISLYNVTGYLSDILSYSRLLALGLATSVISMVVNTMGTLGDTGSVVGVIMLVIVSLIGHTFNLAISALGAYVHTSRLQYVEFFGKFYTGGGKAFKPLRFKNKYIKLED